MMPSSVSAVMASSRGKDFFSTIKEWLARCGEGVWQLAENIFCGRDESGSFLPWNSFGARMILPPNAAPMA